MPAKLVIPSLVQSLADQVHMTPIAWNVTARQVVIVFEQGPKLTFEREAMLEAAQAKDTPAGTTKKGDAISAPVKKPAKQIKPINPKG